MKCSKCDTEMVEGIAIDPVGFESNYRYPSPQPLLHSETLRVIKCLKCPTCGFSDDQCDVRDNNATMEIEEINF